MKIKIYQVNNDRDENRVKFTRFENLARWQGTSDIQSHIYDRVFDGDVDCKNLEGIYTLFNTERPVGHMGHSLSVSDIVQIELDGQGVERGFYYCDSFGFQKVDFEPQKALVKEEKKMKVVMIEPEKEARIVEMGTGLEAMQQAVGGYIETMYPFDEEVAIVCNEEGKMTGLPLNRAIYMEGEMIDIIAGKFFICATPSDSEDFESLSDEQAQKYCEIFKSPERFYRVGDEITAIKVKPSLDEAIAEYKKSVSEPGNKRLKMTAIRKGYNEFSLYPNEVLEGITLTHGGGKVKVDGVLYDLYKPLSMKDAIKMDKIPHRYKRHKVADYFPHKDEYR